MKKTKFLVGALAVMSFAACQNEEMLVEDTLKVSERAQIDLSIIPGEKFGVESRMTVKDGKFEWEEDKDMIGACMVDAATAGTIVDDHHIGNAQFTYKADTKEFTTASTMTVGTWMFYYPYNEANTGARNGIKVPALNKVQEYDADGTKRLDNNFMVAPVVNMAGAEPGSLKLPMTFYSVYAYARFTVKNDTTTNIEVQKIVLKANGDDFILGGTLKPSLATESNKQLVKILATDTDADVKKKFEQADSVYRVVGGAECMPIQWINATTEKSDNIALNLLTGSTGKTIEPGKDLVTWATLPLTKMGNVKIVVYTTAGVQTYNFEEVVNTTQTLTNNSEINNAKSYDVVLEINDLDMPEDNEITAINTDDLIAGLKPYAKTDATEKTTVKVTLLSDDFVLTQAIMDQIADNIIVRFAAGTTIAFEGDMTLDEQVTFADGNANTITLKDGNIVVDKADFGKNSTINLAGTANVTVNKVTTTGVTTTNIPTGTTLTITENTTEQNYYNSYLNVSGGTLNIGSEVATVSRAAEETPKGVKTFLHEVKHGVLNINAALENASATYAPALGNISEEGQTIPALTVNVNDAVSGTAEITINELATVNVNANIENTIQENNGKMVIAAGVEVTEIKTNNGEIDNSAKSLNVGTNEGTITHKGILLTVSSNEGTIDNQASAVAATTRGARLELDENKEEGVLTTVARSQNDIITNLGEIYYVEDAYVNIDSKGNHEEKGNVIYKMTSNLTSDELAAKIKNTKVSSIKIENAVLSFGEDYDYEENTSLAQLKNIIMNGNAGVTVNAPVVLNNCPVYVYGEGNKIDGSSYVAFVGDNDSKYRRIVLGKGTELETSVVIAGLTSIALGENALLIANTNIYGEENTEPTMGEGAAWIGTQFEVKGISELTSAE